ncbi:MAG: hypothetical protein HY788_03430 [Deltaproteobacteria bacterium]|nr:hypothetical protein [Deltaproteobacteria bacterium]
MILNPAIIALIVGSLLTSFISLYSSMIGARILKHWNLKSGSELQLALEHKTYLVSTVLAYVMGFQVVLLFLFVYTADRIHPLFIGAMCAAGSLNANSFGYLALVVKILSVFLSGIWLILNYTDHRGYDYPLIRLKYKFLFFVTAALLADSALEVSYFLDLEPDVITSCCGSLFSEDAPTITGTLTSMYPPAAMAFFFLTVVVTTRTGLHFLITGNGWKLFSYLSSLLFVVGIVSLISFISVYYYELPTHHCPFCVLQKEYGYIGYPLYLFLLGSGITGTAVRVIGRHRQTPSLQDSIPALQRRLCIIAMAGFVLFTGISVYPMIMSDFILLS